MDCFPSNHEPKYTLPSFGYLPSSQSHYNQYKKLLLAEGSLVVRGLCVSFIGLLGVTWKIPEVLTREALML